MKRIFSRQFFAQIEIASRSLRADSEGANCMRRLHIVSCGGAKVGRAQSLDLRRKNGFSGALSSKADKAAAVKKVKTELRSIPGVGPKNEELLRNKGIVTVESLRSVFQEKFDEDQSPFVTFLKEEIGIRHKHHCQSIAGFLTTEKEVTVKNTERITVSIEGNISAGKTTFLSWLADKTFEIRDLCEVVHEPVDKWQCVGDNKTNNLLQRFYESPHKHAYEFQNYVFLTRMDLNRNTFEGDKPLRLLERSVFSDRLVFVRAIHEAKWLTDEQLELYDSWFNPMLLEVPGLIPDGFIYLRADPSTCMRRLRNRGRQEEKTVTDEYLEGLHEKHEDWFKKEEWTDKRSILLPQKPSLVKYNADRQPMDDVTIPDEIKESVIWLGRSGILSRDQDGLPGNGSSHRMWVPDTVKMAMDRIPALVLDCNTDIDVSSDEDAKRQYATKVRAYFEFIKQHTKRIKQFYKTTHGETLRRKWDMVNKMHVVNNLTEEQIRNVMDERSPRVRVTM